MIDRPKLMVMAPEQLRAPPRPTTMCRRSWQYLDVEIHGSVCQPCSTFIVYVWLCMRLEDATVAGFSAAVAVLVISADSDSLLGSLGDDYWRSVLYA